MIYKFRLLSSEKDDFIRDFEVIASQTFYDLHMAIQKNCKYDPSQIASFFICNNDWEKETEITLFEIPEERGKITLAMEKSVFLDYIKEIKQKLVYVFDVFNERAFFIELVGIRDDDTSTLYPRCTLSEGSPPVQIMLDGPLPETESNEESDEEDLNESCDDESLEGEDESIEE
jgi:Plasmid pRiA4b ORF-3-like protein